MATKKHLESNKKYLSKFDEIETRVPKGKKDKVKEYAQSQGKSLNGYFKELITKDSGIDL